MVSCKDCYNFSRCGYVEWIKSESKERVNGRKRTEISVFFAYIQGALMCLTFYRHSKGLKFVRCLREES
jgi:hypothetical protein